MSRHVAFAVMIAVGFSALAGCGEEQVGVQIENDPNAPAAKRMGGEDGKGEDRVQYLIGMLQAPVFGKKRAACQQLTRIGPAAKSAIQPLEEELAKAESFLAGELELEGEGDADDEDLKEVYTPELVDLLRKAVAAVRGEGGAPASSGSTEGDSAEG